MTNSTKAQVLALINALLLLAVAFDVALTQAQIGAIGVAVNAVLAVWVGLTYKDSAKRIPDA
ncbi:MAG: hypothetical protein NUW01_17065 [Gemmatimonadaceae bacterium]|nr:hypothetical protein [Gemmatimonadaceae bacterium]